MKKIAIYGMGAIGGLFAARLAAIGCQVSAVARGANLAALQEHGVRLKNKASAEVAAYPLQASDQPASLGVQDVVIIAVKAPALADVVANIAPLIGPETIILSAMNGVPWWFFAAPELALHGMHMQSLDGDGSIARALPYQQVIGCVVHLSSSCPEPGLVELAMGNRLILGEAVGAESARLQQLASLLSRAGFEVEQSQNVRADIWYKLWGNMTINPISAFTGATADLILDDALVHGFCLRVMQEAADLGAQIGCPIEQSGEDRMVVTRKLGALRTSMLQDVQANKTIELDALLGVAHEIGLALGVATPNIDALYGLTRVFGKVRALYP